jgi:streptomycin 6-kinase
VHLPDFLRENVAALHGEAGTRWFNELPGLLRRFADEWSLSLGTPYLNSSYSYVVQAGRADGTRAVLKLCFPSERVTQQSNALRAFGGVGTVELLAADTAAGALLIERGEPGSNLVETSLKDDRAAVSIAAHVASQFTPLAPSDVTFPSIDSWVSDLDRLRRHVATRELRALADEAFEVAGALIASSKELVLLHGDLHHENIVLSGRGWLAVDPAGIFGERACEAALLVINPLDTIRGFTDPSELLRSRLQHLSEEMGLERERLRAWSFVRAVLGVMWALEDHSPVPQEWLHCTNLLRRGA